MEDKTASIPAGQFGLLAFIEPAGARACVGPTFVFDELALALLESYDLRSPSQPLGRVTYV
jgi:hypothetical protein